MGTDLQIEFDVVARMRDDIKLRANIYRPRGSGAWPTLLMRTPYGKDDHTDFVWTGIDPIQLARTGFVVVVQDTRGRFASDGLWEPLVNEGSDGYDTVEWAARLPASNGRVAMFGGSYCGNTQWLAAIERPPSLVAISPLMTWADPMDGLFSRGGAFELGKALNWPLQTGIDHVIRLAQETKTTENNVNAIIDEHDRLGRDGYWELPVSASAVLSRHQLPDLGSVRSLADPRVADTSKVAGRYTAVKVSAFQIGGWYDVCLQGTIDNHLGMINAGRESQLVIGPWTHERFTDPIGDQLFGLRSGLHGAGGQGSIIERQLHWLRQQVEPKASEDRPSVRIFVMGRNEWRDETSWPPARARDEQWFLHSDFSLSRAKPAADAKPSEFVYDPTDPTPTVGGNIVMWPGYVAGPKDQAAVEARRDLLTFTSGPLDDDLEVTGRVRAVMHAESSAPSTDWVVRLCDVYPDGTSVNICDGILRIEADPEPGGVCIVDLWSTSNVFVRGHRLRVHVASSSFPRWDRNLNTGDQNAPGTKIAHQKIHHEPNLPSFLVLPVCA